MLNNTILVLKGISQESVTRLWPDSLHIFSCIQSCYCVILINNKVQTLSSTVYLKQS